MGAQVGKAVLATRTYQDASLQASLDALMVFAGASAYNAGFPEMVVPMVMQLKLFAKATQVCVYMCIHRSVCVCMIYVCIYIYTYMYIYIYLYVYICMYIHAYIYTHKDVYMSIYRR